MRHTHRSGYISAAVSTVIFAVFIYGLISAWEAIKDLVDPSTQYGDSPIDYTMPTYPSWYKTKDK